MISAAEIMKKELAADLQALFRGKAYSGRIRAGAKARQGAVRAPYISRVNKRRSFEKR
jgi:hypothetical protein